MNDVRIRTRDDGPLVIEGPVVIVDAEGNPYPYESKKAAIALCRCGASQNRPFCDGTHKRSGFQAADRATDTDA